MKKISEALLILCIIFCCYFCVNRASACSPNGTEEQITGGACSIKDLNNLESTRASKAKSMGAERDLRPVKINSQMPKQQSDDCIFGKCLYRQILELKSGGK